MNILVVCLGNICRSPLAEGLMKQKALQRGLYWNIDSAGTNGYHTGEAPHHLSRKVAMKNGLDISSQCARNFIAEDIDRYDMIYVMADDVMRDVKKISGSKFDPEKVKYFLEDLSSRKDKNVPDPWYGEEDGYDEVFVIINEGAEAIINSLVQKIKTENNV